MTGRISGWVLLITCFVILCGVAVLAPLVSAGIVPFAVTP